MKTLIEAGSDPNLRREDGATALMIACSNGHKDVVKTLISSGANVNFRTFDTRGDSLMCASAFNHPGIVQILIDHGADVNAASSGPRRALHYAAERGYRELVSLLLSHGAEVNVEDCFGFTPLRLALQEGYHGVAELLRQHGGEEPVGNRGKAPVSDPRLPY